MARIAHVQGLRGCLYTLRCFHIPTYRFHGTVQRLQQANPPHIQAGRAQSLDELKRRIHARRLKDVDHAHLDR